MIRVSAAFRLRAAQPCGFFRREGLRNFGIATPVDGNENQPMAEVFHRYVRDPALVEEREAVAKRREAAAKKREEAAKRRQAAKQATSRATWCGIASLRLERMAHEKTKRLEREMEIAARRGELIEKAVVERQAAFLLTAMRQRCMSAPSAWSRRLLNLSDPRVMTEQLRRHDGERSRRARRTCPRR